MRISLSYKIIFFFSAVVLTIIVITSVYFYNETEKIFKNQILYNLINIAEISEGQIFLLFENKESIFVLKKSNSTLEIRENLSASINP